MNHRKAFDSNGEVGSVYVYTIAFMPKFKVKACNVILQSSSTHPTQEDMANILLSQHRAECIVLFIYKYIYKYISVCNINGIHVRILSVLWRIIVQCAVKMYKAVRYITKSSLFLSLYRCLSWYCTYRPYIQSKKNHIYIYIILRKKCEYFMC